MRQIHSAECSRRIIIQNNAFRVIPSSLYTKVYFWSYDQKHHKLSYYLLKYFSSLKLKHLKLTKMDLTQFAMKLFICIIVKSCLRYIHNPV